MNFKISKIALALPLTVATLSYAAQQPVDGGMTGVKPAHIENLMAKSQNAMALNKETNTQRYFVMLKDAPLAVYNGDVTGYQATSILATNGENKTAKGILNINSAVSQSYMGLLTQKQQHAKIAIAQATQRTIEVKEEFKMALNAMVMELTEAEARKVASLPGVIAVNKEERHQLQTDRGPIHIGAPEIWGDDDTGFKGEGIVVGIMDTGVQPFPKKKYAYQMPYTEADFHPSFADKVLGPDGVTVEYDHTNPNGEGVYNPTNMVAMTNGCVDNPEWCSDKLISIISFAEITNRYTGYNFEQWQNGKDTHGHGTHTASTTAGNPVYDVAVVNAIGEEGAFSFDTVTGVAPRANIISYQTCHPTDGCWPSLAVKSIEHAMANGVSAMNYSVGGSPKSPWFGADALAMMSAREAGMHIAVSAGNSGRNGPQTVGSPGNSPWVTTVAAYTHDRDFDAKVATFTGGDSDLADMSGKGATPGLEIPEGFAGLELRYAGDMQSDYNNELYGEGVCGGVNYSTRAEVTGKVLVCKRGGVDRNGEFLARVYKSKIAKSWGAVGMILINTDNTSDSVNADFHSIPTIHINKADGEALLAWMATGEGHTVDFNASSVMSNPDAADIAADFTSRGPDRWEPDYMVPDIAGPGVNIYAGGIGNQHYSGIDYNSRVNGAFRFMSGTSMSSPHVAGALTLMAGHPDSKDWTPAEVQSALMMTAHTETYTDDDYDGVKTPSTHFDAGSGSMRVNRAVKAGLVMNETQANYLAANPLAEEYGMVDDIAGWHGEPSLMNMPSMQKGSCLLDCSWTRTFRATKAGTWDVSSVTSSAGFEITFSPAQFTVAKDEMVELTVTASANQALADEWVFGRVVLTPTDTSTPTATLPVSVNFIAGLAPEFIEIDATRNNDSVATPEIITIGTDDLQVAKTGLAKATVVELELERDATNNAVVHYPLDGTVKAFPINIQARSKRLVVDVLSTTSPDVDIYIGIDDDLNGEPNVMEFAWNKVYMSAASSSDELIDIIDPKAGTYWLLVHNWAEPDVVEPVEGEEPVEAEPQMDSVKISYAVVSYDDETMTVDAPQAVDPRANIGMRINWDKAMAQDSLHYGAVELGTSAELATNIGAIRINMTRGEDDVLISDGEVNADAGTIGFDISVALNNAAENRDYNFSVELAQGVLVDSLFIIDGTAAVASLTAAKSVDYTLDGNMLSWNLTQSPGDTNVTFSLIVDTNAVKGYADVTPVISSWVNTSNEAVITAPVAPVFVEGRPVFAMSASETQVKEGELVTLTAEVVDPVTRTPAISYTWSQVSGPAATIEGSGVSVTVTMPKVKQDSQLVFQLVGSNGSKTSEPVTATVDVADKSNGGSFGFGIMGLIALAGLARRQR